jgi:CrcB protein
MSTFSILNIAAIAGGGALGAAARYGVTTTGAHIWGMHFPYGTMLVNVLGSFAIGALVGLFAHSFSPSEALKLFLVTGFLGSFTTFSAYSLDVSALIARGEMVPAGIYAAGSVIFSLMAVFLGMAAARLISNGGLS